MLLKYMLIQFNATYARWYLMHFIISSWGMQSPLTTPRFFHWYVPLWIFSHTWTTRLEITEISPVGRQQATLYSRYTSFHFTLLSVCLRYALLCDTVHGHLAFNGRSNAPLPHRKKWKQKTACLTWNCAVYAMVCLEISPPASESFLTIL